MSSQTAHPRLIRQTSIGEVAHRWDDLKNPIRIGRITIRKDGSKDEIVVSGRDKKTRPWNVYVKIAGGLGYSLAWTADLDGDGLRDLVFLHQGPVNGRCVTRNRLTTILFDREGRPAPCELEGSFEVDYSWRTSSGRGVLDLGDWNEDGHAELVQTDCYAYFYQHLGYTAFGFVDVYEADEGVWHRVDSKERALRERTYRKIAASGGRKLAPRPKELGKFIPDYSNDQASGTRARIASFVPGDVSNPNCGMLRHARVENGRLERMSEEEEQSVRQRCEAHIVLENGTNCYGMPGIVLLGPDSTEASLDWKSDRTRALLQQVISEKLPVTLTGQLESGVCSPVLIWAHKP